MTPSATPSIIVPNTESIASQRGRFAIIQITDRLNELIDRGKTPTKITISTAIADDMRAYFDFNHVFDGVLPREYCGVPIEFEPGAGRRIRIETQ